jgi:hypothetical protein
MEASSGVDRPTQLEEVGGHPKAHVYVWRTIGIKNDML